MKYKAIFGLLLTRKQVHIYVQFSDPYIGKDSSWLFTYSQQLSRWFESHTKSIFGNSNAIKGLTEGMMIHING